MPGVQFKEVEVIELPIVAGEDHPSQYLDKRLSNNNTKNENCEFDQSEDETNHPRKMDSASITIDWKPQSRTTLDIETFEQERSKKKKGRLKKLTRAVRKRM